MQKVSYDEVKGERTLIIGDVSTGKTQLTKKLLIQALKTETDITVIDMAPPSKELDGYKFGGQLLQKDYRKIRYLWPREISTPRLSARKPEELLDMARHNERIIKPILERYGNKPSRVLFVNDVSIYLQQGILKDLWYSLSKAQTLVVNGYQGEKLRKDLGTGLSERERRLMDKLASKMDNVIRLAKPKGLG